MEAEGQGGSNRRANTRNLDTEHDPVHPQLLHANATCYRWAFGAIAELVDNVVAEIDHGATALRIDRIVNPRNKDPALLFADDGRGMNPHSLIQSMVLPSIDATCIEESVVGHYQSGLKATTMRLGTDAVVFTVCPSSSTASVGLLSFTYLARTQQKGTLVPILNYKFPKKATESTSGKRILERMQNESNEDHWNELLQIILRWSPYSTEQELLQVFGSIGDHGTQIVVYNLWRNKDRETELEFESREDDIQIRRSPEPKPKRLSDFLHREHVADRFRYSLRAYLSILYLHWPGRNKFSISLRGRPVEHYDLVRDLKFTKKRYCNLPEVDGMEWKPRVAAKVGFLKEAPLVNIRGFNLYHKNRLIVPFWRSNMSNELKGIVGIVKADCLKPAPGKQEFERSPISCLLETRIIQLSTDFWKSKSRMVTYVHNNRTETPRTTTPGPDTAHVGVTELHELTEQQALLRNLTEQLQLVRGEKTSLEKSVQEFEERKGELGTATEQLQLVMEENRALIESVHKLEELKLQVEELQGKSGTATEQPQPAVGENTNLKEILHRFEELQEKLTTATKQLHLATEENRTLKERLDELEAIKEKMRKIKEMSEL